jgi:MFS transporter, DHA1 family, multidrug resistance protein
MEKIKLDNNLLIMFSLIMMVSLLPTQYIGGYSIIGPMSEELDISKTIATSHMFITFALGLSIGEFIVGPLSDKYGKLPIFIIFLNIYSISSVSCSLFYSEAWFLFFRLISGFTVAAGIIISRAIIADHCNMSEGTRVLSKVKAASAVLIGIYPFLIDFSMAKLHLEWRSHFIFNAIFCSIVSSSTIYLLHSLGEKKDKNSLSLNRIKTSFKHTLANKTYCIALAAVILVSISINLFNFLMPSLLLEYLNSSTNLLSLMQGLIGSIIAFFSLTLNAICVKRGINAVSIITTLAAALGLIAILLFLAFYSISNKELLLQIYLVLYSISLLCVIPCSLNLFLIASQTIDKKKVGSGFITSLTVSLKGFASFLAVSSLPFLENITVQNKLGAYAILTLICFMFILKNKNTLASIANNS